MGNVVNSITSPRFCRTGAKSSVAARITSFAAGLPFAKSSLTRKQPRGIVVQNLALCRGANRQSAELFNVSLDLRYARPGPVRAPQNFVCDVLDARKAFHQFLRWDAGNIHVHIFVAANKEKRFVHPQGSATVRKNDNKIRVVNAHVVAQHWLRMQISGAGENRSSRMNHDRHAVRLRSFVNRRQAAVAIHVIVWRKRLVRGMHLNGANPEFCKTVYFRTRIWNRPWEHAAESDEAIRRRAAILRTPVIHFRRKTNNLRG